MEQCIRGHRHAFDDGFLESLPLTELKLDFGYIVLQGDKLVI
jgi:hypothetical protein